MQRLLYMRDEEIPVIQLYLYWLRDEVINVKSERSKRQTFVLRYRPESDKTCIVLSIDNDNQL